MPRAIHCQRIHVLGSARACAQLVMFSDLKSPKVTTCAFGGGGVAGVCAYHDVRSCRFYVRLLFYVLLGCENDRSVRVLGDSFTLISD